MVCGYSKKIGNPKACNRLYLGVRYQMTHTFSHGVIGLVDDCYETCVKTDVHKAYNKSIMLHYPHQQADRRDDGSTQWILHYLTR